MMHLTMMKDFFETENIRSLVSGILKKWEYEKDPEQFIRASSNFVLSFEGGNRKYILRLTPNGNIERLNREISFLTFLVDRNVSVNKPIPSKDGKMIETLETPFGRLYAVVFQYLDGDICEMDEVSDSHYRLWGEALGKIHYYSKQFCLENNLRKNSVYELLNEIEVNLSLEKSLCNELNEIRRWIETLPITEQNYGYIHYDFELDNIIWDTNNPQMLDFESAMDCWYAADIAFALRDVFEEKVDLLDTRFQLFLAGYRNQYPISDEEIEQIPMFLRFHHLLTYTRLTKCIDLDGVDQPEWLVDLIEKLKAKLSNYGKSFHSND
jgi:Ser/Thr protein kinase RdoA (MazF antagonist)